MKSMFSYARRTLVSTLAIFALAVGLGGCANDVESSSPSDAVYEVAVAADGNDVRMDVKVSSAAANEYQQLTGNALDKDEVSILVSERIRKAVDEGAIELSADSNAQIEVVFDVAQKEGNPGLQAAGESCLVSWGVATYTYQIIIRDAYGCRYYNAADYYDVTHNNCNGANTLQYLYSTQYGPYWGC